jgi:hypothetical protein
MKLNTGETKTITVSARDKKAGDHILDVAPGEWYSFKVPDGERWKDWYIDTDAEGYPRKPFFPEPRLQGVNYFCLCGLIEGGDKVSLFKIGKELPAYEIAMEGRLYYFANDYHYAYWNNKGAIQLEVTRNT